MNARAGAVLAVLLTGGCGYRPLTAAGPAGTMSVAKVHTAVADFGAAIEVEQGVREALVREGALATGDACPCVHVELTRIDRSAGAIVAQGDNPRASSQIVALVARATVDDGQGHTLFDTGDVRASEAYTVDGRVGEVLQGQDSARAVARRLGRLLGARLLGHPAASEDAEGR